MHKKKLYSLLCGCVGGLLAGISLGEGISLLMPFALGLLWASSSCPSSGFVWGFLSILYSHKWILALHPLSWVGIPGPISLLVSTFIWLFCGLLGGFLVWTWCFLLIRFFSYLTGNQIARIDFGVALSFSIVWGLAEVWLAKGPLFWIGIGSSLLPGDISLAGIARLFGAGGIASLQLLIGWWLWSLCITFSTRKEFNKLLLYGITFICICHVIGWNLLNKGINSKLINVAMWQTNIPIREKYSKKQLDLLPANIQSSLIKAKELNASVLVAPEGTLPLNNKLIESSPIRFLSGGFRSIKGRQRSSLLFIDIGKIDATDAIDKHRLVPLGEWSPSFFSLSALGGLQPGEPSRLFKWKGPPLIAAICYEISDGTSISRAAMNGGEWILSLANLDPYPIGLQRQFLSLAQLRSIESSRDLAVVSNTGPTVLIKSSGKVESVIPPFQNGIEVAEVNLNNKKTFYSLFGEKPLIAIFFLNLILLFDKKFKFKKNF